MNLNNGKLAKMLILAYPTSKKGEIQGPPLPFPVMYNPKAFSKELKVCFNKKKAPSGSSNELEYAGSDTGTVSFQFLLDATGASVNSIQGQIAREAKGVDVQIETFHTLTTLRNPDTHQPNILDLVWGTFIFRCRLKSAKINYTLFNASGRPLRATIDAMFEGHEQLSAVAALNKLFSADLSHVYLVKSGETLPYIASKIYGDIRYYLEIARINNLKNFRKLEPGSQLILPPVEKIETR